MFTDKRKLGVCVINQPTLINGLRNFLKQNGIDEIKEMKKGRDGGRREGGKRQGEEGEEGSGGRERRAGVSKGDFFAFSELCSIVEAKIVTEM